MGLPRLLRAAVILFLFAGVIGCSSSAPPPVAADGKGNMEIPKNMPGGAPKKPAR